MFYKNTMSGSDDDHIYYINFKNEEYRIPYAPLAIMPTNIKTKHHIQKIKEAISNTLKDCLFDLSYNFEWCVTYDDGIDKVRFEVHIYKVDESVDSDTKIVEVQRMYGNRDMFRKISQQILTAVQNIPERELYIEQN